MAKLSPWTASILCRNTSPDRFPRPSAKFHLKITLFLLTFRPFPYMIQHSTSVTPDVLFFCIWTAVPRKCAFGLRRSFCRVLPYNDAEDYKNPKRQLLLGPVTGMRSRFFARQRKATGNPVGFPRIFLPYRGKDASGPCAEIWQFCRKLKMKRGMINVGKAHSLVESFHDLRGWRYSP